MLVTGASGIVGSWLTRRLVDEQAHVVALVLDSDPQSDLFARRTVDRVTVVNGRLENYADVERAVVVQEVDSVIHLGAQTLVGAALRAPLATFEANIRGTYHLLEACRLHADLVQRIVVASSDKAYGDLQAPPYVEDMPATGRHPYDLSKSCADLIARGYASTYDLPVSIARCSNVYGGGDLNWSRLVPGTIRSLLRDERPILRSDGTPTRDYVHVDDVVDAYLLLCDRSAEQEVRGLPFNFGAGRAHSAFELVDRLRHLVDRKDLEPIVLGTARSEIASQYLDSTKASRVLGWKPAVDLETGLLRTLEWYRAYFARQAG
ncbi:MAG: GDP-mannose 4,6-dehydratase [Acidimicrobiales bacterium]